MSALFRASTRVRWAAIGAAIAVTLGGGALGVVHATTSSGERAVFVPITPCRLFDTRAGSDNIGIRHTPIAGGETFTQQVRGTNGNCTVPADAVGVAMNVTTVNGTAASFLTIWPADATKPLASSLNWIPGSPPTPNKVDVKLSATGAISLFNNSGNVDVLADVVGYYVDHNHDDRYYTKAQVYTKAEVYSKAELYSKAEIDDYLAGLTSSTTTTTVAPPKPLPRLIEGVQSGHAVHGACGQCPNYAVTMNIPAGRWLVSYAVTNVNFEGTSDLFRCWFELTSGGGGYALSTGRLGGVFPNVDVMPFSGHRALTLAASANVRIACSHDGDISGGVGLLDMAYMEQGVLTALEVSP